jgi:hypothetical protein
VDEEADAMRTYLGDAVSVDVLQDGIVLTTSNGARETNRIVLNATVLDALIVYIDRLTVRLAWADEQPALRLELAEDDE